MPRAKHEITIEDLLGAAAAHEGPHLLAGIDEAGRGALAGPVVAACVIFPGKVPEGLADSKILSAKRREGLYDAIMADAVVGIGIKDHGVIDELGITHATYAAMADGLGTVIGGHNVDRVVIDGNYISPDFIDRFAKHVPVICCMVKADAKLAEVSAASIVAKVTRDRYMARMHEKLPAYRFDLNAGYPSPQHLAALAEHGPSAKHRKTFAPVAKAITEAQSLIQRAARPRP